MTVSFITLGCKLNQTETEAIASAFLDAGHRIVPCEQAADLYIVNTCTVTTKGEQKARRTIRKILKDRADVPVIVTGCYVQMDPRGIAALGERVIPVPLDHKDILLDLPGELAKDQCAPFTGDTCPAPPAEAGLHDRLVRAVAGKMREAGESGGDRFRFNAGAYSFHSRPPLKIQDGCDNHCSYCRVTLARGPSVSLEAGEVLSRVQRLEENGFAEVVLTGVNISSYRSGALDLPGLIERLLSATSGIRLRLSSLEPDRVDDRLAKAVSHPRVCPHFHLPVQSGSDAVLAAMKRRYTSSGVRAAVSRLRAAVPDPFLAADVIVGFPGESDLDFRATADLLSELDFAHLHVFPYSPRPGTAACFMSGQVPQARAGERASALKALSDEGFLRYGMRRTGRPLSVVLESDTLEDGIRIWTGMSGNHLKVRVADPEHRYRKGRMLSCTAGVPGPEGLPAYPIERAPAAGAGGSGH